MRNWYVYKAWPRQIGVRMRTTSRRLLISTQVEPDHILTKYKLGLFTNFDTRAIIMQIHKNYKIQKNSKTKNINILQAVTENTF